MNNTIEQKTADAVLQRQKKITIGDSEYTIGKPSVATVIMLSELVSQLPPMTTDNGTTVLKEVLRTAKDTRLFGRIVAVLILGAKQVIAEEQKTSQKSKKWLFWRNKHKNLVEEITEKAILNLSPSEMSEIITDCLNNLEIGAFFVLTTSLRANNILKPTKSEVVTNPTTQSGH